METSNDEHRIGWTGVQFHFTWDNVIFRVHTHTNHVGCGISVDGFERIRRPSRPFVNNNSTRASNAHRAIKLEVGTSRRHRLRVLAIARGFGRRVNTGITEASGNSFALARSELPFKTTLRGITTARPVPSV